MTTLSSNRFEALMGGVREETDPLGNTKTVKQAMPPRSKRDVARKLHTRVAISPPSRRGRDRAGPTDYGNTDSAQPAGGLASTSSVLDHPKGGNSTLRPTRGRQFDRHSGTGIQDNMKKINQGWGRAGASERDAENDTLSPNDPAAEGEAIGTGSGTATPVESNYKTLDEYLATQCGLDDRYKLPEARQANEGVDPSQLKNAVVLERSKEEDVYFSGKESAGKHKNKSKKEKVYLEIDQPSHHQQRIGGGGGRRDPSAFPNLGA
ncbi:hypothetical protein RO3G_15607 [Lichtheimia corymbifera JMRC:FSU:9682]|uniref:Hyaluronan/mRNA-binding protein domain-containing protein n=1 Tax=Lichtheimia corymbifera JMRC:FSU:9682 TaxID=1263082 RepID=A0A068RMJ2_9FUNG|nr:hypothetical protein RO3G_15607 [Lichtheimia corymbifera JMRC:FSU:9682]